MRAFVRNLGWVVSEWVPWQLVRAMRDRDYDKFPKK